VKPSEWIPFIFADEEPGFRDMEEAEEVMGARLHLYTDINKSVRTKRGQAPAPWPTSQLKKPPKPAHPLSGRQRRSAESIRTPPSSTREWGGSSMRLSWKRGRGRKTPSRPRLLWAATILAPAAAAANSRGVAVPVGSGIKWIPDCCRTSLGLLRNGGSEEAPEKINDFRTISRVRSRLENAEGFLVTREMFGTQREKTACLSGISVRAPCESVDRGATF